MIDWKPQVGGEGAFPFLVVDNWYDDKSEKGVWSELNFLSHNDRSEQKRADKDKNVARDLKTKVPLGKSYRWYLNVIYTTEGKTYSSIIRHMENFRTPEFHKIIKHIMPQCRSFLSSNQDTSMVSYYENNDYYKAHHDSAQWTSLCWFFREPKQFTGGGLTFTEPNYKINLKHNRMVMFPSYMMHEVEPVKFDKQPKDMGYGRYTITHFFYNVF
jgi:Rps23 Pro-64 3,4-dihydroxylase Tpa1-like proline 4-hydroxylase